MKKNKKVFHISKSVIETIEIFKQQNKGDKESGGILLGQVVNNDIYITKITTPNIFDKATRFSFECDKDAAQIIIDYEFINSEKKTIYLGEWHTHPENEPTPSGQDKKMIKSQYLMNRLNEPFILLLIQGITGFYFGVRGKRKLRRCSVNVY